MQKRGIKLREEILSVGIDIGTSTTQLVFSRLVIENTASSFSIPRISIVEKEIIYRSIIHFTPLVSRNEIDGKRVREIIELEYEKANVKPAQVKTGAVIITGETARKENASQVLQTLSGLAGDFVVATAGPDLESIIAGKGAGADRISREEFNTVVNLDIGGGTTNYAVFTDGELVDTGCLDIGGRLIKVDKETRRITYIADKIKHLAKCKNIEIEEGQVADMDKIKAVVREMVLILEESLGLIPRTENYFKIVTNKGLKLDYKINSITFSGGVADYIYNEDYSDALKFGDIGVLLGEAIRNSDICEKLKLKKSIETIRATVVGAGSHTTDISGSTITYTKDVFPVKNLPILKLSKDDEGFGFERISKAVEEKLKWFSNEKEMQPVAIAINGMKTPSFKQIQDLATVLADGMKELIKENFPVFIIVENDIAKVLGQTLYKQLGFNKDVVCIDSIRVENGDYIDIGKPLANGRVVPVVIKTLVFNS